MLNRYLTSRLIPLPHVLTIELTSYCNLSCVMCPKTAGFVNTSPDRVITSDIIERLDPILGSIDGVDLSGLWGEAFLHPELYVEILGRLKRRNCGVRTVSNGTCITEELAERLVALGLDCIDISVDAARPETYRKIRMGGELEQVIRGVRAINRFKRELGRRTPDIRFLFLGMTDNIAELPEFVRLAHSLHVSTVVLQAMGEYEDVKGKSVALGDREMGRRLLKEARAEAGALDVTLELFPPDQFSEENEEENAPGTDLNQKKKRRLTKDCFFPWDRAVITTEGNVLACCSAPEPFGNLREQSFKEIWYGDAYTQLRRSLLTGKLPLMCRTCTGVGWKEVSARDRLQGALRLEKNRFRQMLRRSAILRRAKDFVRPRSA